MGLEGSVHDHVPQCVLYIHPLLDVVFWVFTTGYSIASTIHH